MKNIILSSLFLLFFVIYACTPKDENNCFNVDYNTPFDIEVNNKYQFPDGNSFYVKTFENNFCPCNVVCAWEGEMVMSYTANFDGQDVEHIIGSSLLTDSTFTSEDYAMIFHDVVLDKPCTMTNPSPNIQGAEVELRRK